MSRRHRPTTPRRKAHGRTPKTVRVPFRCMTPDCGRISVHLVPRGAAGSQELPCPSCGKTWHARIHCRPESVGP